MFIPFILVILSFVCCIVFVGIDAVSAAESIRFNRDVRPILSDKCFACHGPDANTREADLRLDQREDAIRTREGHQVVSPGSPETSELMARITSHEEYELMPPPEHGEPLSEEEISVLRRWIQAGAGYEQHWSFAPIKSVEPPEAANVEHPIDAFISRRLVEKGFEFSPQAKPRVLLRRLSFDLTGLPPSPADVARFEQNPSFENYQTFVDQYLTSPHFGERLAIYWLDLVRYADSLGFHGDQERSVSPYRDYVINAFNDNKPFDEFTLEQLAGDLLPEADLQQKVASTYNRLNKASGEGGVQPKEYLAKYAADRVRTTGMVWLGTTIGCAECHDHKFDPYTARDFYSFAAFFADIKEQGIVSGAKYIEQLKVPTSEQSTKMQELQQQIAEAEQAYTAESPEFIKAFEKWQSDLQEHLISWQTLVPNEATGEKGTKLDVNDEGIILASGPNPEQETYRLTFNLSESELSQISALKLELFPDESLPAKGPGRAGNGNFVVNDVVLTMDGHPVKWANANATHSQNGFPAANLATNNHKGWAILPETGKGHQLVLTAEQPIPLNKENGSGQCIITITQNHGSGHTLGRFRFSATGNVDLNNPLLAPEDSIRQLVEKVIESRTATEQQKLLTYYRDHTPLLNQERDQLNTLKTALQKLDNSIVTTLVSKSTTPREMRVLPRGNWMDDSGEVVEPAVPHFLPQPAAESERLTRLDLAKWMVSPENPLVSRTFVNRLWMLLYGRGLSPTVDDLGAQGQVPTHPELLDWLAHDFIESGWDIKAVIRLMVTSQTYRQSSQPTEALQKQDPYNSTFARQSRWRLDAEMIRDNALAVSGLLVDKVGGTSVKPYQPAGYWAQLNFPKRTYQSDQGDNQYRRGVYTHWQRTFLHPSLLAFDAPAREECTARRERSNTPLQSLALLNDPTYIEAARQFAQRILTEPADSFEERIKFAWREVLTRAPTTEEVALVRPLLETNRNYYEQNPAKAEQLLSTGLSSRNQSLSPVELAAWTAVSRALLNLHETITRY